MLLSSAVRKLLPVMAIALTIACHPTEQLNPTGSQIRVVSTSVARDCNFIRQISVNSKSAPGWGENPAEDLHNKLRNRAADLGGNFVHIDSLALNGLAGGSALGSVYKCEKNQF